MNISAARERAGITQGELAKRMEVTQGAVSQWESGQTRPRSGTLSKLADIFCAPKLPSLQTDTAE